MMSAHLRFIVQKQDKGPGAYHIRLSLGHPSHRQASRLLFACGGRAVVEAAGIVYRFITIVSRDHALDLVRLKHGYTVASSFDGLPWRPGDPESLYFHQYSVRHHDRWG
jgi:hypothetical protein